MVGMVIVSHSRQLAEAACRLAKGVGSQDLPVAFAGGSGENHEELGTDATEIMEAVQQVSTGDGVIVLMDLGSAVLSARLAQQMLDDDIPNIRLCPAPLVEGAVAAAVQMGTGAPLDDVCREAQAALGAKIQEMGDDAETPSAPAATASEPAPAEPPADAALYRFTIDDPNGMHTRPAADFVRAVSGFDAEVRLRNGSVPGAAFVSGRSLNSIALAGVRHGDVIETAVWGRQRDETLAALRKLVADVYHGKEAPPAAAAESSASAAAAVPDANMETLIQLSPGIAAGTLFVEDDFTEPLPAVTVTDPEAETARLDAAVQAVREDLTAQKNRLGSERHQEADIIEAQTLILEDAEILGEVKAAVRQKRQDAASAYQQRMNALAAGYRALPDAYMRERAADAAGVAGQVLAVLTNRGRRDTASLSEVIVCASEIAPSHIGRWRPEQLAGILTREGGASSHAAILARALGIPALSGFVLPAGTANGAKAVMDANALRVIVSPNAEEEAEFRRLQEVWRQTLARDHADAQGPAVTRDGTHIPVWANVGDTATAEAAVRNGAEGIGLLRTEFLFLGRRTPPDEEEQTAQLTRILRLFAGKPVTVRTLDAGGDKPMPWLELPPEANPFLGVRGVRLLIRHPDLCRTQMRAVLRAGHEAGTPDLRVMIPMIATLSEMTFARDMLDAAHGELTAENTPHVWPVRFGIMIETPAAVLQAEKLAAAADFFSIGTNDLTQYVMCAERGSKELAAFSDGMHPAVLTAVGMTADAAGRHGTELAVCGEMAGDPEAAAVLAFLGVHHLSMNASAIGGVKRALRGCDLKRPAVSPETLLRMASAAEVRQAVREAFGFSGNKRRE